jgi:hypothetical protein
MRDLLPYTALISGPLAMIGFVASGVGYVRYKLTRRRELQ